jgi:hypothetical protein
LASARNVSWASRPLLTSVPSPSVARAKKGFFHFRKGSEVAGMVLDPQVTRFDMYKEAKKQSPCRLKKSKRTPRPYGALFERGASVTESTPRRVKRAGKTDASFKHSSCKAYQFDFYIPKKIWKLRPVMKFFDTLSNLGGATVFDDEIGIWKGEKETTQVFRLVVRDGDLTITSVRATLQTEIVRLMAILRGTKHRQEAMMYTETRIRRYMVRETKG